MGLAVALGGTLALGLWLRSALAGWVDLPAPFVNLRHAHSHLGYYGLLFPLAWRAWGVCGRPTPGSRVSWAYALAVAVAILGFVTAGYGPVAIVGSTAIAGFWLWSATPLVRGMRDLHDPLGAVPIGLVLSLSCVPPVAMTLRVDPELAHRFVATFLSSLLLLVVVPSVFAARRVAFGPWPLFVLLGASGALALGVAPHPVARFGLIGLAALLARAGTSRRLAAPTRVGWGVAAAGMACLAAGVLPNTRPVALGATHFLVLGPLLGSAAPLIVARPPSDRAALVGLGCATVLAAPLVAQGFGAAGWTSGVSAVGGAATLVWWGWVASRSKA